MRPKALPSQERLKELFDLDLSTWRFTWKVSTNGRVHVGDLAGMLHPNGYRYLQVDGVRYMEHRLIFVWMTGTCPYMVDHRHGERANNQWDELRACTGTLNKANEKRRKDNVCGFKGVGFNKRDLKFQAKITIHGKTRSLGYFNTAEAAYAAYCKAAKELFGEFARTA